MKPLLGIGILLLLVGSLFPQEQKTPPQCTTVALTISLKAGDNFKQRINSLTFKVKADQQEGRGWMFSLEDTDGHDYIYPVNPPLRFNPSQILGPGYGESARQSLGSNRELRFLLDQTDYYLFKPFVVNALWPYSAPHPDHAAEEYFAALDKLRTGLLRLKMLRSDVAPNDAVRTADVQVEFIAPSDFHFDPSSKSHPVACPRKPPAL